MKRIVLHWTAGGGMPSNVDKVHYHRLVDVRGEVHDGLFSIEDNRKIVGSKYAAHTRGCNTGSIGLAICCMAGAIEGRPEKTAKVIPTREQVDKLCWLAADLAIKYEIETTDKTILCHSEVEQNLGIRQRGKWDIEWLPWDIAPFKRCGDWLRHRIEFFRREIANEGLAKRKEGGKVSVE